MFKSHVNAYQTLTSAEEIFRIKWNGWSILWIPASLWLQPVSSLPSRLMNKHPWWQGRRLCTCSAMWISIHQGPPAHCWVLNLPAAETNIESLVGYHSLWWSANYLEAGWLHCTVSIMEETITLEEALTLDSDLPACNTSYRMTNPPSWCSTEHCFCGSSNLLYIKWSVAIGPFSQTSLFLPCFPRSWIIWLDRTVEQPFEDSLTAPAMWQYLVRMRQGSPGGCVCSESVYI